MKNDKLYDRSLVDWLRQLETFSSGLNHQSLAHVLGVAKKLDVLDFAKKIITVAGTNGKSSSVVFLEAILLAAGYKTGAYISPHLLRYNERVRVNGVEVDDGALCQAFSLVDIARAGVDLSYFEFTTLAALVIFKQCDLDFLILEVGLGGIFDAVNILHPDISIITTISLDHVQILGETREAIGREKSGIMRRFKPVICGSNMPDSIYLAANNLGASLYELGKDFFCIERGAVWGWQCGQDLLENLPWPRLSISNASLAIMAVKLLSADFKISSQAIITGLKNAILLGRWQKVVFNHREIIFDVAHNHDSAILLANNLAKTATTGRVLAVASMLADKDIDAILEPFQGLVYKWYVGVIDHVRAASSAQLSKCFHRAKVDNFTLFPTVGGSLLQAIAEYQENDRIAVFGSFHTVMEGLVLLTDMHNEKLSESRSYES